MIDTSIINDKELLEKARELKREKSRVSQKEFRRKFKEKYGINYNTYLDMKHIKEGRHNG